MLIPALNSHNYLRVCLQLVNIFITNMLRRNGLVGTVKLLLALGCATSFSALPLITSCQAHNQPVGCYSLFAEDDTLRLFILANGFMVVKALRRREYHFAILYFLFVAGAVAFFTLIEGPAKIGG
jgi:hypothetical protein